MDGITMKNTLVSAVIVTAIATSAAQADVSVCINNKTGKARFSPVCTIKETQQFLTTSGGASGDVRTISKKVIVPKGTLPGHRATEYPYSVTMNFSAEISCSDQDIYLGSQMRVIGADPENFCSSSEHGNFESGDTGISVLCGGGDYAGFYMDQRIEPTSRDITLYLVASCIKK